MPLDSKPLAPFWLSDTQRAEANAALHARAAELNRQTAPSLAVDVIAAGIETVPNVTMVSSFGADAVVLLHLAASVSPDIPVLFIDTEMLFPETLEYQRKLSRQLGLTNVTVMRSGNIARVDPDGSLHKRDTDACCALRKTQPLENALSGVDGWISGRKRFQSGQRAALENFEVVEREGRTPHLKINPLARWDSRDVANYIADQQLPRHPLVSRGYPSIGCAPCTTKVRPGEDPRSGRWRDQEKEECGIHFVDGKMVRMNPGANT